MARDYGFDLPDTRHGFYDTTGKFVAVRINRHWYQTEDDETNFKVSFSIIRQGEVTNLPVGCDEGKAVQIAHELYQEDAEATDRWGLSGLLTD